MPTVKMFFKKVLSNLLFYFKDELVITTNKISKFTYSYSDIKQYNISLSVVDDDIVTTIRNIDAILESKFYNSELVYGVPKISEVSYVDKKLLYWLSDNESKLEDLNLIINTFNLKSSELINKYNDVINNKKDETNSSYNIRILKPYIINICNIRDVLLEISNKGVQTLK